MLICVYICVHAPCPCSSPSPDIRLPIPKRQNETHPYLQQIQASGELSDARQRLSYSQIVLSNRSFLKKWFASNGTLGPLLRHTQSHDSRPTAPSPHLLAEPNIKFVEEIVTKRKAELNEGIRADQKDVLTLMLTASDPQCVLCARARSNVMCGVSSSAMPA